MFHLAFTAILMVAFLLQGCAAAVTRSALAPVVPAKHPVISNVRAVAGTTSCTITWDTDQPSDSLAALAIGMGTWIPALSQLDPATTDTAAPGVTNHTATISNLWPQTRYDIYLRSRPFSHGAVDGNPADYGRHGLGDCARLKDGSACRCSTLPISPSGSSFDFRMQLSGTRNVVQGYDTYLLLLYGDIARPMGFVVGPEDVTIGGLPPNSTISIYDPNHFIVSFDSGTDLLRLKPSIAHDDIGLHIATTGSTPLGAYTITLRNAHAERYPSVVHSYSYTLSVTSPSFLSGTPDSYPRVPSIGDKNTPGTWVYGMVTKGASAGICRQNGLHSNFYDAIRAYQQTQAYDADHGITGNPAQWNACISSRETGYLNYINLARPPGAIPSIYLASNGMMDLALGGDSVAQTALFETADNFTKMRPALLEVEYERELDFITESYIAANKAGDSKEAPLIPIGIDYLLADVDQIVSGGVSHEPFLDGAMADTLIHYYIDNGSVDARIPMAVKALADHLWVNYWIPGTCSGTNQPFTGCFAYLAGTAKMGTNVGLDPHSSSNLTNLNLMIAPMYAWLFKMTGNGTIPGSDGSQCGGTRGQPCTYQQAGDSIFASGVRQSDYYYFKDWAQNFRWSFDYVKWRSGEHAPRGRALGRAAKGY